LKLIKVIDHLIPKEKQHWVNPIIEARLVKGTPKVTEPHKLGEWRWFSLQELPESITLNLVEFFKDVKGGRIKLQQ
jgi:hypothetical protein